MRGGKPMPNSSTLMPSQIAVKKCPTSRTIISTPSTGTTHSQLKSIYCLLSGAPPPLICPFYVGNVRVLYSHVNVLREHFFYYTTNPPERYLLGEERGHRYLVCGGH